MDDLPLIEPEQSRLPKAFVLSVLAFTVMMLTLPVGVYLVGQQTDILPQAQTLKDQVRPTGFKLQAPPSQNGQIPLSVWVSSDLDSANLFVATLNFPQDSLEVVSINPEATFRWIEEKFDNNTGLITLIAYVPGPGLKTDQGKNQPFATINFKPRLPDGQAKKVGSYQIAIDDPSAIFRNSDNLNILVTKDSHNIEVNGLVSTPEPTISGSLTLSSPQGGEAYLYSQNIPIQWSAKGVDKVVVSAYLNGLFLGKIGESSASGEFLWNPLKTLPAVYLTDDNTFEIEVSSDNLRSKTNGPFEILVRGELPNLVTDPLKFAKERGDFNGDSQVNFSDLSLLVSNFSGGEKKYDLNEDGIINGLDLWLIQGIIDKEI